MLLKFEKIRFIFGSGIKKTEVFIGILATIFEICVIVRAYKLYNKHGQYLFIKK